LESDNLNIQFEFFEHQGDLPVDEARLLESAMLAAGNAYAPFSSFKVGCAVLLESGEVMSGNNQENIAFPSGICAERSILYYIGTQGRSGEIRKIAIRASSKRRKLTEPVTPCGACRQVMVESEKVAGRDIIVLMQGETGRILRLEGVGKTLMPFHFNLEF
jgi:cytidine deaminase